MNTLFLVLALGVSATASGQTPAGFSVEKDVAYKTAPDQAGKDVMLHLDVYTPSANAEQPRSAVLFVHGGSLMTGSKSGAGLERLLIESWAKAGHVVVSIDYRLHPNPNGDANFNRAMKDAMSDVVSALDWMKANAAKYQIDMKKVALAGYSAGAEMVSNLCYTRFIPTMNPKRVAAVVAVAGNTLFYGDPELKTPPCLIVHGDKDDINPLTAAQNLQDRLKKAGVPCEMFLAEGTGHFFENAKQHPAILQAINRFLAAAFAPPKP